MIKVLVTYPNVEGMEGLLEDKDFSVDIKPKPSDEEFKKMVSNYDCLLIRSEVKVTKEVLENADSLKLIGRAGTGVDNIDVEEATKRGIVVMNVPGGNTLSACEHTFALMLALSRNIPSAERSLRSGLWEREKFTGGELYGKTLGIIGFGRVGKEVAKRAISFGMNVIVYDPYVTEEYVSAFGAKLLNLDELLSTSDFISLHVPLTEATKNMINKDTIEKMKPEACLINTSRGKVIDEEALYNALKNRRIKGAALDVYEKEPLPKDSKLLELDNVVLTPHLGASTEEAQVRIAQELSHAVKEFFKSGIVLNAVNMPSVDLATYQLIKPYLELSERIGKLQAVISEGAIREINLTYSGEIANYDIKLPTLAFLKGLLGEILDVDVNYVNSLYLAKSRGINITETKSSHSKDYTSLFSSLIKTDKETCCINGTVFTQQHLRITEIKGIDVDVRPEGYMVIISNIDKPGVIGALGTILGKRNINIASMEVGRKEVGGEAIIVLNVDSAVDEETVNEIKNISGVLKVKTIKL